MSMMNCSAAIQAVLDQAAARVAGLIVIRVDVSQSAAPASLSRRLLLPLSSDAQLAFALGCAQAGLRPVLDLTALRDAPERLESAFAALPRASRRPLVIRVAARRCPALPGVHVIAPANARECAGAMRFALQADLITLIVENPLCTYEACEVPDDPEELFAGTLPLAEPETPAPEETPEAVEPEDATETAGPEEAPEERAAEAEAEPEPEELAKGLDEAVAAPAPDAAWAYRARPYDPAELARTASLLGMELAQLAALCCAKAGEKAQLALEPDAEQGELCFLPPEEGNACLWVGRDRLTLCWNARALTADEARNIMESAAARLALPARLILD